MAETAKITQVVKLLKRGQQREAMDYMYDAMNGTDLTEISQLGTRITALADAVSNKKSREREMKRRQIGGGDKGGDIYASI